MANTARISQSATEVLALQPGNTRISQSAIEALVGLGISCASPPNGTVSQLYTHTFPAGSGDPPYTFSIASGALPAGLSLNASTGVVSGVPSAAGTFAFTIQVTDSLFSTALAPCSISVGTSTIVPSSGGAVSRCQVSHVLPSRLTARDWSAFQRQVEALHPADVEEVRGSRFDFC